MNLVGMQHLALQIKQWGQALGFQQVGITDTDLSEAEQHLQAWLAKGYQGEMDYMHRHGLKRSRPELLHEGTVRVISVRMDYQTDAAGLMHQQLTDPTAAYISRYALGRDYHKLMRNRLQKLVDKIHAELNLSADADVFKLDMRPFVDSAPVLEKALA